MREIDLHENEERKYPSLIIYLLDCRAKDKKDIAMFKNGVVAYGICFPGSRVMGRQRVLATYQVNTTWMKNQYGSYFEDDDDLGDDIE